MVQVQVRTAVPGTIIILKDLDNYVSGKWQYSFNQTTV